MENFEYSILMNDRDWAEFDSASEECSLIPPALATTEDQVLSDLEEGEAEENRLRVSLLPTRDAAKCHLREAPDTRLLAEDIWSGREDEIELGSINSGEQLLSCGSSEPWQNPGRQAGFIAECEVAFATKEGKSDTGERPIHPGCPSPVVADSSLQEEDFQDQSLGHLRAERPPPAGYMSPPGGKGNAPLSLELQRPKNETVSVEVLFPTSTERMAVSENAERSTYCSSENLSVLQAVLEREATLLQETPSAFQARNAVASSHPPSQSHGENPLEKVSHSVGKALDFQDKKGDEKGHVLQEGGQADHGRDSTCVKVKSLFPGEEEGNVHLNPTQVADNFPCDNTKGGKTRRDGCSVSCAATELPDMYGPEMYEYFFKEMDTEKEERSRDKTSGTFLGLDHQSTLHSGMQDSRSAEDADSVHISTPEVYEHFFPNGAKARRTWRGFLLRLMTAAEAKKAARALTSFLSRPVRRLRSQPTSRGTLFRRRSQGRLVVSSPRILDERPETGGTAAVQPGRPLTVQPVLTPRDMCLGFVAFASWAVKTSDLQAPDAWKIVLLANVGTLSAIRYFRRQVVMERWHDT